MNINKVATEISQMCQEYRNCDGAIKASLNTSGGVTVYQAYGSTAIAYEGDNAQKAFDRVIFSINLNDIDWKQPLRKYIVEELRAVKKEMKEEK